MLQVAKIIGTGLATTGLGTLKVTFGSINLLSETFQVIFRYITGFILLFLGFFIVIYLFLFLIILIYNILYYLISKIDWIKNKETKEFVLINKNKFLLYIIKFLFIIIFVGFFSFILKNLLCIGQIECNNIYYYIFNLHMFFYWISFILIFYILIYFFTIKIMFYYLFIGF